MTRTLFISITIFFLIVAASIFFLLARHNLDPKPATVTKGRSEAIQTVTEAPLRQAPKVDRGKFKPMDPVLAAQQAKPLDADLVDWLRGWTKDQDGMEATPEQERQLTVVLTRTNLPSRSLFDIAEDFHSAYHSGNASAEIYRRAVLRAHDELVDPSITPKKRKEILEGYLRHRDDFKHTLWPIINATRDATDIDTICTMYHDVLQYYDKNDRHVAAVAQSIEIGYAECLSLQGRFSETLKQIKETDMEDLSKERRSSLEWIWGLTLTRMNRDEEAIEHLKIVAVDPKSEFVNSAAVMVVRISCKLHDLAGASTARAKYQSLPNRDDKILAAMDTAIARASPAP